MNDKQMLIHYESQIEVLQSRLEEYFKSSVEKDVINLNYKKSAENYTSTIEALTLKLQEFESVQDNHIAAVESRNEKISQLESIVLEKNDKNNKLKQELDIAQEQITTALKEYDEKHQSDVQDAIEECNKKIKDLENKLSASRGDNNVEIQNLRRSAKEFELSNRTNLQSLSEVNAELNTLKVEFSESNKELCKYRDEISKSNEVINNLKKELSDVRETEVQASRISSQLTELKGQQQAKIAELTAQISTLTLELEEAKKPKPKTSPTKTSSTTKTTTSRRRKSTTSK